MLSVVRAGALVATGGVCAVCWSLGTLLESVPQCMHDAQRGVEALWKAGFGCKLHSCDEHAH